jgi:hypothetical protein
MSASVLQNAPERSEGLRRQLEQCANQVDNQLWTSTTLLALLPFQQAYMRLIEKAKGTSWYAIHYSAMFVFALCFSSRSRAFKFMAFSKSSNLAFDFVQYESFSFTAQQSL